MKKLPKSYKEAGVDIEKIRMLHKVYRQTFGGINVKIPEFKPVLQIGHYAGVLEYGDDYFAFHVDGVGTKILVAQMMNYYETIGQDVVAMGVNDLVCIGAKPVAFMDYLAIEKPNKKMISEIINGIRKAAEQTNVHVIAGETAVIPEMIKGAKKLHGFDIVGFTFGHLKKDDLVDGSRIQKNDVIIGLESNGLHSNGYTLARKILLEKYSLTEKIPELGGILGEELLKPTRIYSNCILEITKNLQVNGLAHITGGGFTKLLRLSKSKDIGFSLEKFPLLPPIFKLIMKTGDISISEMFKTFNCGIGFCIIADKAIEEEILEICAKHNINAYAIGKVVNKRGVFVKYKGRKIVLY